MCRLRIAMAIALATVALSINAPALSDDGAALPRYRLQEIPNPTLSDPECLQQYWTHTDGAHLNDKGLVTGAAQCYTKLPAPPNQFPIGERAGRAFAWTLQNGTYDLPALDPNLGASFARGSNNRNTIVGYEISTGETQGLRWSAGGGVASVISGSPECFRTRLGFVEGINESGAIAGWAFHPNPAQPPPIPGLCGTAWVYRKPGGEEIVGPFNGGAGAINNFHVLVGNADRSAVKWRPLTGQTIVLARSAANSYSVAYDINDREQVVGWLSTIAPLGCDLAASAKLWEANGTMRTLPALNAAPFTRAFALNDRGDVVGGSGSGDFCEQSEVQSRAVLWRNARAWDLNRLALRRNGVTLTVAMDINRNGQILARGYRPAEGAKPCPRTVFPEGGEPYLDTTRTCFNLYSFLLHPVP